MKMLVFASNHLVNSNVYLKIKTTVVFSDDTQMLEYIILMYETGLIWINKNVIYSYCDQNMYTVSVL